MISVVTKITPENLPHSYIIYVQAKLSLQNLESHFFSNSGYWVSHSPVLILDPKIWNLKKNKILDFLWSLVCTYIYIWVKFLGDTIHIKKNSFPTWYLYFLLLFMKKSKTIKRIDWMEKKHNMFCT